MNPTEGTADPDLVFTLGSIRGDEWNSGFNEAKTQLLFFFFFVLSGLEMQVLKSVNTTQKMVVIQINQKIHILKFFKISSFKTKSEYQIF